MARLFIFHHRDGPSEVHKFRNFAEDLVREFRGEKWIEISLEEVDRAINQIELRLKPSRVKRARQRLVPILKRHLMEEHCSLIVE